MKKPVSFVLTLALLLPFVFGIFSGKVHALNEYEVHVAVFCEDSARAQEYVRRLCEFEFKRFGNGGEFLKESPNPSPNGGKTFINDGSNRYHTYFHVVNLEWINKGSKDLEELLKQCTVALILYDISDPTLDVLMNSSESAEKLLQVQTPLNNFIRYTQSFGISGWYNAISYVVYDSKNLEEEVILKRRVDINQYSGSVEDLLIRNCREDNRWDRGHPVWNTDSGLKRPVFWVGAQADRSIQKEKILTGHLGMMSKKKSRLFEPTAGDTPKKSVDSAHQENKRIEESRTDEKKPSVVRYDNVDERRPGTSTPVNGCKTGGNDCRGTQGSTEAHNTIPPGKKAWPVCGDLATENKGSKKWPIFGAITLGIAAVVAVGVKFYHWVKSK